MSESFARKRRLRIGTHGRVRDVARVETQDGRRRFRLGAERRHDRTGNGLRNRLRELGRERNGLLEVLGAKHGLRLVGLDREGQRQRELDRVGRRVREVLRHSREGRGLRRRVLRAVHHGGVRFGESLHGFLATGAVEGGLADHEHVGDFVLAELRRVEQVVDIRTRRCNLQGLRAPTTERAHFGIRIRCELVAAVDRIQVLERVVLHVGLVDRAATPVQVPRDRHFVTEHGHTLQLGPVLDVGVGLDLVRTFRDTRRERGNGRILHRVETRLSNGQGIRIRDHDRVHDATLVLLHGLAVVRLDEDDVHAVLALKLTVLAFGGIDETDILCGDEQRPRRVLAPREGELRQIRRSGFGRGVCDRGRRGIRGGGGRGLGHGGLFGDDGFVLHGRLRSLALAARGDREGRGEGHDVLNVALQHVEELLYLDVLEVSVC